MHLSSLFSYPELLVYAKNKRRLEEWMEAYYVKMNPQCQFINDADTYYLPFYVLADTNKNL